MNIIFLTIWYIFLIVLPIGCLVIRIINSFSKTIQEMDSYILLAAIIYGFYMAIFTSCKRKKDSNDSKRETLISNSNTDIIRDYWFKYLFCLCIGTVFIPKLISNLESNFASYSNKNWEVIVDLVFSQMIIPLIVIIDTFLIPRSRVPNPLLDLLILLGIIILFVIIEFTKSSSFSFRLFLRALGMLIANSLFSFNGYVLYDYILYKKIGGPLGFNLFSK